MRGPLLLAARYLAHHKARTLLTAACVALVTVLPLAVEGLVRTYGSRLAARSRSTPLLLGAPGSRFDLTLSALYFRGRVPRSLPWRELEALLDDDLALPVPVHVGHAARGFPLVGTTPEYYAVRGLELAGGELPLLLGEAVLGAQVARELGLGPGDALLTDQGSLYDLTAAYPLRLRITGVLREADTPDDRAVFCDVRTSWVADGLAHGHRSAEEARPDELLGTDGEGAVFSPAVVELAEVTPENVAEFHEHGDPGERPLTGVLLYPRDARAGTILKGRAGASREVQVVAPAEVVDELTAFVLRLKTFFDANAALVLVATLLFLGLLVGLTVQVRRRELETLVRIGCARGTIVRVLALEVGLTIALGVAAGAALALVLVRLLQASALRIA